VNIAICRCAESATAHLDVPFEENAAAKAAGALFDPAARRWYVGSEAHLMAVQKWWPKA